eukprot:TRINITY_DN17110_c0_g1_i1.p1 TRINITY_DN17110_c0_g1~~TRINITY_DN17110_c0_g1_i1.p1  ORF type:complete len:580 (-),score=115.69 TRINITY_DN17110_c0_g1_i1:136-1812(-)
MAAPPPATAPRAAKRRRLLRPPSRGAIGPRRGSSCADDFLPIAPPLLEREDCFGDEELARLSAEAASRSRRLRKRLKELQAVELRVQAHRRLLAREAVRRQFSRSPFGRLRAATVLPFLDAADSLRWAAASTSALEQVSCEAALAAQRDRDGDARDSGDGGRDESPPASCHQLAAIARRLWPVAHLSSLASSLQERQARTLVNGLVWGWIQTMAVDLASLGWRRVLDALVDAASADAAAIQAACTAPHALATTAATSPLLLRKLRTLSVSFPAERSAHVRELWSQSEPKLLRLCDLAFAAPLQELVLADLRSISLLEQLLRGCSGTLRVCRATFIGPESRQRPLELPASTGGLPRLRVLALRHRDFREQRTSRQERMAVSANSLWSCLRQVKEPLELRVLVLAGLRVDGDGPETAALLQGLGTFKGLSSLALRLSVPSTFGTLVPWNKLLQLRCSWPRLGYLSLGDMSIHGFDYWPEQVTDFQEVYGGKGGLPLMDLDVFCNEFGHVLSTQYGLTAERQWALLDASQRTFWASLAKRLPSLPHSELRLRLEALGAGSR